MKENQYYITEFKGLSVFTFEKISKSTFKVISHELQSTRGRKKAELGSTSWHCDSTALKKWAKKYKLKEIDSKEARAVIRNGKFT